MGTLFGGMSVTLGGRDDHGSGKKGGWEPFSGINTKL